MYLALERKRRDIVFGFPWCVKRGSGFLVGTLFFFLFCFFYLTLLEEEVKMQTPFFFLFQRRETKSLNLHVFIGRVYTPSFEHLKRQFQGYHRL